MGGLWRRSGRWGCVGARAAALGALLGVATQCSFDERELTSDGYNQTVAPASGASELGRAMSSSCGDCVANQCDCTAGNACGLALKCLADCDGESNCLEACAASFPVGVVAARALETCQLTLCSLCSEPEEEDWTAACDSSGAGACESEGDCSFLRAGAAGDVELLACSACSEINSQGCTECVADQTSLSLPCSGCLVELAGCVQGECGQECEGARSSSDNCASCRQAGGCLSEFLECSLADQ